MRSRTDEDLILALLVDRATEGLDPGEEQRLRAGLQDHPHLDADDLDLVAARLHLFWMRGKQEGLPPGLHARLQEKAQRMAPRQEEDPR